MWPTPPNYNAFHPLRPDDVTGIHKIYGQREPKWHDKIENSNISSIIAYPPSPTTPRLQPDSTVRRRQSEADGREQQRQEALPAARE